MFKFSEIPKILINLDRRSDRLEKVVNEFNYIKWGFERFSAIDTNSYIGCALSHQNIAKLALERNYDYVMVCEDDIFFMPYVNELIPNIESELNSLEWDFFHLGPSIHRPMKSYSNYLVSLSDLPPKNEHIHRGIYGTSAYILTKKACEILVNWDTNNIIENISRQIPIDVFMDLVLYPKLKCFCPTIPLVVQREDFSDINKTIDNNFYTLTYNWNLYFPEKIPTKYLNYKNCLEFKKKNES
jgi:GR25 family glycosyltransferase involved in LPS biosynthesis